MAEKENAAVARVTAATVSFGMVFQGQGEGRFVYKCTAIDNVKGAETLGFTREHDGAKLKMEAARFNEMIRTGGMVLIDTPSCQHVWQVNPGRNTCIKCRMYE